MFYCAGVLFNYRKPLSFFSFVLIENNRFADAHPPFSATFGA